MGAAATELFGADNVTWLEQPRLGSEDFADMLETVPGAYVWLGQAPGPGLHNPTYQFECHPTPWRRTAGADRGDEILR